MDNYLSKIERDSLQLLFSQAPIAIAMIKGNNLMIDAANEKMLTLWKKGTEVIGAPLLKAIPELAESKFPGLLQHVLQTGEVYRGVAEKVVLNGIESYFDFTYAPVYQNHEIIAVSVVAAEVTTQVRSEIKLKEIEIRYRDLILNADVSTAIYWGEDLIIGLANEKMLQTWGKEASVIGMKLEDALPELQGQPFLEILKNVYRTGETYAATEDKVFLEVDGRLQTFYYNFSYKPIRDANGVVHGILNMAVDVTDLIETRLRAQQSKDFLNSVIQHAPMSVSIMKGPNHEIIISNSKTKELWGGQDDRIGKELMDAYPTLNADVLASVKQCYHSGTPVAMKDTQIKLADGTSKYINYVLTPLKNDDGITDHIISIGYDITDDILLREKLIASEVQFRILANQLPQLVWTTDSNGHTNFYSDRWYEYTGIPRNKFGAASWQNCIKEEQRDEVYKIWMNCIATGNPYEVEYLLEDGNHPGNYRWFLAKGVPIRDKSGNIVQWVGSCTDIHELKESQRQKDTFLGIVSHELKTPLTSVKIYSQLLEKTLLLAGDHKNASLATKVDEQINKLNSLVADLLDVTKIHNGKLQLNESHFDFDSLVQNVVADIQISTGHHIITTFSARQSVTADRNRIEQVIINLLNNAIKYSPKADKVLVTTTATQDTVLLTVQDFGIGMEKHQTEKVFEQFYRVSGTQQHTFPGLGLGLYISSEIIKRAGGKIWVQSAPGKGSAFTFEIPKIKMGGRNNGTKKSIGDR